jgi:hypothetical protein
MHRFEFQNAISRIAAFLPKKREIDFDLWIKFDRRKLFKGFFSCEKYNVKKENFRRFKVDLFQK